MTSLFAPAGDKKSLEEGVDLTPKFGPDGLVSAIVVDADDGTVLMLGHMNDAALKATIDTREAHYWSRSRQELWHKGATSGNVQKVQQILIDCDQDAVVLRVKVTGADATCHTGRRSCFYREIVVGGDGTELKLIDDERLFDPSEVYSSS